MAEWGWYRRRSADHRICGPRPFGSALRNRNNFARPIAFGMEKPQTATAAVCATRLFRQRHHCHCQAAQGYLVAAELAAGGRLESRLLVNHVHVAAGSARDGHHKGPVALVHQQHLVRAVASGKSPCVHIGQIEVRLHLLISGAEVIMNQFEHPVAGIGLPRYPIHKGHRRKLCGVTDKLRFAVVLDSQ